MLTWNVFYEDINQHEIIIYDIFAGGYYEGVAKDFKAKAKDKKEFADCFEQELRLRFWKRAEYETVITSWPPYIKAEGLEAIQQRINSDEKNWGNRPPMTMATLSCSRKVDIFEQLKLNWDQFIDYIWNNI